MVVFIDETWTKTPKLVIRHLPSELILRPSNPAQRHWTTLKRRVQRFRADAGSGSWIAELIRALLGQPGVLNRAGSTSCLIITNTILLRIPSELAPPYLHDARHGC
jgi:hypothetical protein